MEAVYGIGDIGCLGVWELWNLELGIRDERT